MSIGTKRKALVVVLGELARSPRMQYHCMSLSEHNYGVTVISIEGSDKSCNALESDTNIQKLFIIQRNNFEQCLPSILAYLIKPILQLILLILQLCYVQIPHIVIVQNPPSIPTLPILYCYCKLVRSKLVIDWHNYGYSILRMKLKESHPLVFVYKFIEVNFGKLADAGLTVSEAMRDDLKRRFKVNYPLYVLYDKPSGRFKPMNVQERHTFFHSIKDQIPNFISDRNDCNTRLTRVNTTQNIEYKPGRPAVVCSSTSWTADENFGTLLDALVEYDRVMQAEKHARESTRRIPRLICVITGKGPLKSHYESRINKLQLEHVEIVLPWLKSEDYPKMVGSCDLGVSLHESSSKVDLPMKVVDLFGCAVPVLAFKYDAIGELVIENEYGLTFSNSQELASQMIDLLGGFYKDNSKSKLERFRKRLIEDYLNESWEKNWASVAKPLFDSLCSISAK